MGGPSYFTIVQDLVELLTKLGRYDDLEKAVTQALSHEIPEVQLFGGIDGESFLDKMDDLVKTWVPSEDVDGKDIYYYLVVFYFILDQKALKDLQSPILPQSAAEPLSELSDWLVNYAKEMGKSLDEESSLTAKSLATFYSSPKYNMNDYIVPRGGWKTFNDFFARSTKPGYRPIASLCDSRVIVSPADCTFDESFPVSASSQISVVKNIEWDIHDLLKGSQYAGDFAGGLFMHSFLNTYDYHRLHAPVDGTVIEAFNIPGQAYLKVSVEFDRKTGKSKLKGRRSVYDKPSNSFKTTVAADDDTGYQFLHCRGLVVLDNPTIGKVAVLPIGMAQVSSVIITAEEGTKLRKGEEIAYFQFGGSDVVVVFQEKANVKLCVKAPLPEDPEINLPEDPEIKMGQKIGYAHPTST